MFTSLGNVIIKPFDGRNPAPVNSYLHICIYIHLYIIISYVSIYPIPGGKQYLHCASISKLFCCWLPASPFLPSRCRASGATSRKGRGSGWQVRRMPWFMEIGVGFSPALGLIRGDDGGESSSLMKAPISWNDIPPSSPPRPYLWRPCWGGRPHRFPWLVRVGLAVVWNSYWFWRFPIHHLQTVFSWAGKPQKMLTFTCTSLPPTKTIVDALVPWSPAAKNKHAWNRFLLATSR